jgi:two-component system LytT family response regulator
MDFIVINTTKCSEIIQLESIVYCCAEGSYTRVYLSNKRSIYCSKNLAWFQRKINSPLFVRLHRSYLVNLAYVTKVFKNDRKVSLINGQGIPISQKRIKSLWNTLYELEAC